MRAVVVGAGISGAFTADTLRARLGPDLLLDVLERRTRTGGRAFRRRLSGVDVETGASLFHSANRLLASRAADLGLRVVPAGSTGALGIWDGSRVVFRTSGHRHRDTLRLLSRYRLPLIDAGRQVGRLVRALELVYPRLERGEWWDSPVDLLRDLGLYDLSQEAATAHFRPGRFRTEFLEGVSRNNYAQDCEGLNALVELVSLAGAGLGGGTLLRVAQGNDAVAAGLLARSGARLRTGATVDRIERAGAGWLVSGDGFEPLEADAVVLAAPLELSSIRLAEVPPPPPRSYVTVHVTFVAGSLRAGALGAAPPAPAFVLTTGAAADLLSIEHIAQTATGALYKVFSRHALTDDELDRFFVAADVARMRWLAYPRLRPTPSWSGFRLAPGLYYPAAMEYAVSTMETQAIAGVAAANLAARDARLTT